MSRFPRSRRVLAAAAGAFLLSACGGNGAGSSPDAAESSPDATEDGQDVEAPAETDAAEPGA